MGQNLQTLIVVAAELRAAGHTWERVARQVHRKAHTVQKWPVRFRPAQAVRRDQRGGRRPPARPHARQGPARPPPGQPGLAPVRVGRLRPGGRTGFRPRFGTGPCQPGRRPGEAGADAPVDGRRPPPARPTTALRRRVRGGVPPGGVVVLVAERVLRGIPPGRSRGADPAGGRGPPPGTGPAGGRAGNAADLPDPGAGGRADRRLVRGRPRRLAPGRPADRPGGRGRRAGSHQFHSTLAFARTAGLPCTPAGVVIRSSPSLGGSPCPLRPAAGSR
jgi:hypothetical protein